MVKWELRVSHCVNDIRLCDRQNAYLFYANNIFFYIILHK